MLGLLVALGLAITAPRDTTCAERGRPYTQALVDETNRGSLAPRKTVVRKLAHQIDSVLVVCDAPTPLFHYSLKVTQSDTLAVAPDFEAAAGRADSAGVLVSDSLSVVAKDPTLVRTAWVPELRRWRLYPLATGRTTLVWRWKNDSVTTVLRTAVASAPAPTPTPTPTPTPAPTPTPTPGATAEAPRVQAHVPAWAATAACTKSYGPAINLQSVLDAAVVGDVVCLDNQTHVTGNFTLRNRGDTGWVVVRPVTLPVTQNGRIRPSQSTLPTLVALGTAPALTATAGARGWYVIGLNVTSDTALTYGPSALVALGMGTEASLAALPSDLVLDRVWVHPPQTQHIQRCVGLQGGSSAVINSVLSDCHYKGVDAQAIAGWNGTGPYLIHNNRLEGSGENVMFGGADPRIAGLVPADIVLTKNHIYTPAAWGVKNAAGQTPWTKKNLLELKSARRIWIEGNVLDGSWPDGHTGYAFTIKSANQGGSCRWCGTADVTIRRNFITNAAAPLALSGLGGDTYPVDSMTRRVTIEENYAQTAKPYQNENRTVMILTNAQNVTLRHNTWEVLVSGWGNAYVGSDGTALTATNLTFDKDLISYGSYGMTGNWTAQGTPGLVVTGLALVGTGTTIRTPNTQIFKTYADAFAQGFGVAKATVDAAVAGVVIPH